MAVIDSGWDRSQTDGRVRAGVGLVDPGDPFATALGLDDHDRNGHGTTCTDLVLRMAPDVEIVPVRIFNEKLETSPEVLEAAISWAIDHGVHVVNLSLGTRRPDAVHSLYRICEIARRAGVIIVSAAEASSYWSFPAVFQHVIGVGAAPVSIRHLRYRPGEAVEFLALGDHADGLTLSGQRRRVRGTSFAAPTVTALVSLLLEESPGAALGEIREQLGRYAQTDGSPASGFVGTSR